MLTFDQIRKIEALGRMYPGHYLRKFADHPARWFIEANIIRNEVLPKERGSCRVLDVGCGFGYFVAACQTEGQHDAIGLDLPSPLIESAANILDVTIIPYCVRAYDKLPAELTGYDVITLFGAMFRHTSATSKDYWGWKEYAFLLSDLLDRLSPGGQIVIRPNRMDTSTVSNGAADLHDIPRLRSLVDNPSQITYGTQRGVLQIMIGAANGDN